MGLFDQFPYTNFHELNLDWILKALDNIQKTMDQFVALNSLKYADPIQWNITSQYAKNTIVIDPQTGTAYISVQPVPEGVLITDTDYWTIVFDLGIFITKASKNFTDRVEPQTTLTATFTSVPGDWLIWSDVLYKAIANIIPGDQYVVGSNIEHFTMADIYYQYLNTIDNIMLIIGDMNNLTTSDTTNLVNAINSVLSDLDTKFSTIIGDLADLNTSDITSIVNAINSLLLDINTIIGDLDNLTTYDKTSVVNAINSLQTTIFNIIGDLDDLNTSDKTSVVNAINSLQYDLMHITDRKYLLIGDSYIEGANHHMDDTWTYDIHSWGDYLDDFLGVTCQKIKVPGAGIGASIYDTFETAFNNATITDPDDITDIIIGSSANDIGLAATVPNMLSGASSLYTTIHTRCPNAKIWIADVGISINPANIIQSQLVHTVYTWFGQFGYTLMNGITNVLAAKDRVQWDGVHPTQLGQMYIALAMLNNLQGISYKDYKAGFEMISTDGIDLLFTNVDGNAVVNKKGSDVITFGTALTGTFSGMAGVSVDLGPVDADFWIDTSTTYNVNSVPGYAYIGPDIYPAVFEFAMISGHMYMFPLIMEGTGYYTGSIVTIVLPPFSIMFSGTYI